MESEGAGGPHQDEDDPHHLPGLPHRSVGERGQKQGEIQAPALRV